MKNLYYPVAHCWLHTFVECAKQATNEYELLTLSWYIWEEMVLPGGEW